MESDPGTPEEIEDKNVTRRSRSWSLTDEQEAERTAREAVSQQSAQAADSQPDRSAREARGETGRLEDGLGVRVCMSDAATGVVHGHRLAPNALISPSGAAEAPKGGDGMADHAIRPSHNGIGGVGKPKHTQCPEDGIEEIGHREKMQPVVVRWERADAQTAQVQSVHRDDDPNHRASQVVSGSQTDSQAGHQKEVERLKQLLNVYKKRAADAGQDACTLRERLDEAESFSRMLEDQLEERSLDSPHTAAPCGADNNQGQSTSQCNVPEHELLIDSLAQAEARIKELEKALADAGIPQSTVDQLNELVAERVELQAEAATFKSQSTMLLKTVAELGVFDTAPDDLEMLAVMMASKGIPDGARSHSPRAQG